MPPQHSVTAPIRFIAKSDPAWDLDRALAELEGLTGDDHAAHPLVAYFSDASRFDLDAPGVVIESGPAGEDGKPTRCHVHRTPRSYLKPDVAPVTWTLRRLKVTQLSPLLDAPKHRGELAAFSLGCVALEGGPSGLALECKPGMPLSDATVDAVADAVGADLVYAVGAAVISASRAPTSAEKKL